MTTQPWLSDKDLAGQFTSVPPEGEGFLMAATTDSLRDALFAITSDWQDAQQIRDVADFVQDEHAGQMRGVDGKTPYEHHLLRTAIRAAQLGIAQDNADMISVALLHDAPEDKGTTLEHMTERFKEKEWYSKEKVKKLFDGAQALNSNGLTQPKYYRQIDKANKQKHLADLHLWAIKGLDRSDNMRGDISFAIRHDNPPIFADIQLRKGFSKKLPPVLEKVARFEPNSGVVEIMNRTTELGYAMTQESNPRIDPQRVRRRSWKRPWR